MNTIYSEKRKNIKTSTLEMMRIMRMMMKEGYPPVPIPVHNKDLKKGTEQKLLKDLGLKKS